MFSNQLFSLGPSLLFLIFHLGFCQYNGPYSLQPRFGYSFFRNIVNRFRGQPCLTVDAQTAVCEDYIKCTSSGGMIRGVCNYGLKACCLPAPTVISASLVKNNASEIMDSLTINRISKAYCQVRVDFDIFELDPFQDQNGRCLPGRFTISGQRERNVPTLCGKNTGQHLYLNFDKMGTPITMNLVTASMNSDWNIRTTQIACYDTNDLAPPGCLQFFKDPTGNVQSFSYEDMANGGQVYQPANQNYIVCIDTSTSPYNTITWRRDASLSAYSFTISGPAPALTQLLGTPAAADVDVKCTADYVGIPDGNYVNADTMGMMIANKFCGLGFPDSVTSMPSTKPFTLHVVTNNVELANGDQDNAGFSLDYDLS